MKNNLIRLTGLAGYLLDIPHTRLVVLLGSVLLMNLYFYLGFILYLNIPLKDIFRKSAYAGISPLRVIGSVALGWTLSLILTALFFLIRDYPGGKVILSAGSVLLLILSLTVFIKYRRARATFYRQMLYRCELYMAVALALLLLL
jgi:hypothetical protein